MTKEFKDMKGVIAIATTPFNNENLINYTCFQLFGADFILTDTLNPFLLEFNKGPEMNSINSKDYNLKKKIINDVYEMVGLFKYSRNKSDFIQII